jgi:hypothetical protein
MSDLADAVFGGQLLGHVIAGEVLTTAVIADAAMTADLAAHMVVDDNLSLTESDILQAKVAQHTIADGCYSLDQFMNDQIHSQLSAGLADEFLP